MPSLFEKKVEFFEVEMTDKDVQEAAIDSALRYARGIQSGVSLDEEVQPIVKKNRWGGFTIMFKKAEEKHG